MVVWMCSVKLELGTGTLAADNSVLRSFGVWVIPVLLSMCMYTVFAFVYVCMYVCTFVCASVRAYVCVCVERGGEWVHKESCMCVKKKEKKR